MFEDFLGSLNYVHGVDVSDNLPKIKEFKEISEMWTKILTEWVRMSDYSLIIGVDLDMDNVEEYMEKYISDLKKQYQVSFPQSNYVQPPLAASTSGETRLDIHFHIDNAETARETAFAGPRQPAIDFYANNEKGH